MPGLFPLVVTLLSLAQKVSKSSHTPLSHISMAVRFGVSAIRRAAIAAVLCVIVRHATANSASTLEPKGADIRLTAPWPPSPTLLEAAELVAEEGNEAFWRFADLFSQKENAGAKTSCHERMVRLAKEALGARAPIAELMPAALALRQAAPKLEAARQVASRVSDEAAKTIGGACCYVELGRTHITTKISDVQAFASSSTSDVSVDAVTFPFDHVHNASATGPTAVLHAAVGTTCFAEFHAALSVLSSEGRLRYVLRSWYGGEDACGGGCAAVGAAASSLALSGYGVALDLKSMEYKAIDDTKVNADGSADEDGDSDAELGGFLFARLKQRRPELAGKLSEFRRSIASKHARSDDVKVWEMGDLALAASQIVASSSEPLRLLTDVSGNFPSLMGTLSKIKINKAFQKEVDSNQKLVEPGINRMLLNGLVTDLVEADPFKVLTMLREEVRLFGDVAASARAFGADGVSRALRVAPPSASSGEDEALGEITRIDLTGSDAAGSLEEGGVLVFNDLERDSKYKRWSSSLRSMLMQQHPGRPSLVARNLITTVAAVNPASAGAGDLFELFSAYQRSQMPIRFAALLYDPSVVGVAQSDTKSSFAKASDAGKAMRATFLVATLYGGDAALDYLSAAATNRDEKQMDMNAMMMMMQGGGMGTVRGTGPMNWKDHFAPALKKTVLSNKGRKKAKGVRVDHLRSTHPLRVLSEKLAELPSRPKSDKEVLAVLEDNVLEDVLSALTMDCTKAAMARGIAATSAAFEDKVSIASADDEYEEVPGEAQGPWAFLVNGQYVHSALPITQQYPAESLFGHVFQSESHRLRRLVHDGILKDKDKNLLKTISKHFHASPKFSTTAMDTHKLNRRMRYTGIRWDAGDAAPETPDLDASDVHYYHPRGTEDDVKAITQWCFGEPSEALGRSVLMACANRILDVEALMSGTSAASKADVGADDDDDDDDEDDDDDDDDDAAAGDPAKSNSRMALFPIVPSTASDSSTPDQLAALFTAATGLKTRGAKVLRFIVDVAQAIDGGGTHVEARCSAPDLEAAYADLGKALLSLRGAPYKAGATLPKSISNWADACGVQTSELAKRWSNHEQILKELSRAAALYAQSLPTTASMGHGAVVSNGYVAPVTAQNSLVPFDASDVAALEARALNEYARDLLAIARDERAAASKRASDVSADEALPARLSSAVAAASGLLATRVDTSSKRARSVSAAIAGAFAKLKGKYSSVTLSRNATDGEVGPSVLVEAIIDPLSAAARRAAPLFLWLHKELGVSIKIYLNPSRELSEPPLKSYYRYVLPSSAEVLGSDDASESASVETRQLSAKFTGLPPDKTLTLHMEAPENWLVESHVASYDLDNLRLEDLGEKGHMSAEFQLEALMIQGSCTDMGGSHRDRHPRGLQMDLLPIRRRRLAATAKTDQAAAAAAAAVVNASFSATKEDTLVMSNLGYFQLKASPGVFRMRLAPGRSRQIYNIAGLKRLQSMDDAAEEAGPSDAEASLLLGDGADSGIEVPVAVTSFSGVNLQLTVARRPGMDGEDVLAEDKSEVAELEADDAIDAYYDDGDRSDSTPDATKKSKESSGSIWSRVTDAVLATAGGSSSGLAAAAAAAAASPHSASFSMPLAMAKSRHADALARLDQSVDAYAHGASIPYRTGKMVHVFSIASGHLYERFLKIMVMSVLSNTRRPVKFWFIRNYLSPGFKHYLPHMAALLKFEYEFVTYSWPKWLHAQTEKQRLIWAYKILFMDVIFPLNLDRVIFIDADQIVRADLGELMDMDLKGAPYAYTPFCSNNKEMDGYRFWSQGFWKDHLQGRPYHISALYVVDLKRFRQTAAGDRLRVTYDNLSKDPNSLANLDQDLPNYAQHQVRIHSLPNEWLWCESWCGNTTKLRAKTIDLCNNPMTKEPKLVGARRIVVEWSSLDDEQRRLTDAWDKTGNLLDVKPRYGVLGAETPQKLASEKAAGGADEDEDGGVSSSSTTTTTTTTTSEKKKKKKKKKSSSGGGGSTKEEL